MCSLAMSSNEEQPWIAVGEVPEEKEEGCVHLLNWKEEEQFHFVLFPGAKILDNYILMFPLIIPFRCEEWNFMHHIFS